MVLVRVLAEEASVEEEHGLPEEEVRLRRMELGNLQAQHQFLRWNQMHIIMLAGRRIRAGLWILQLRRPRVKYGHGDLRALHLYEADM